MSQEIIDRAQKMLETGNNQIAFATGCDLIQLAKLGLNANKIAAERDYYIDQLVDLGYLSYR